MRGVLAGTPSEATVWRASGLWLVALGTLFLAGCAGPITRPSPIMQKAASVVDAPPAGKSLVLIHRPRAGQGYKLYTGVWDSTNFLADLGNGHSFTYACEPGRHYFINRSIERVGVVEAELLPEKIYDLRLDTAGAFLASFQLEPIKRSDKTREKIAGWSKENLRVTRGPTAENHERLRRKEIELILQDFVFGAKKDRLRKLGPDDHR
jgi:hypothetical protein